MNLKTFLYIISFIIILWILKIIFPFQEENNLNKIEEKKVIKENTITDNIKISSNNDIEIYQSHKNWNTLYFEWKYKNSYTSLDVYQWWVKAKKLMVWAWWKFNLEINIGSNEKTWSRIEIKWKDWKTIYKNFIK